MLGATLVFLVLNNLLIYLFTPEHGVSIYGSRTVLLEGIGRYTLTAEQLFILKHFLLSAWQKVGAQLTEAIGTLVINK